MVVAVDEHDETFARPHPEKLGRPLLAAQIEDLVALDGQPAEDGDPLPLTTPAGLGADVNRIAAEFDRLCEIGSAYKEVPGVELSSICPCGR